MSSVTIKDITKVAKLARIEIKENEKQPLASQLNSIINWVENLNEVNTDNIEPLSNVHNTTLKMHKDKITDGDITQDILKNSPNAKYNYFTVPKVIE